MTEYEWKRELLVERIRDMNSAAFVLSGNRHYGAPNAAVERLIKDAIGHVEADELEVAERACERAEFAQIAAIQGMRRG